ncbi:MAG: TIGR04086 family membrane protein [Oscillospiraceae bacterium]|nr:TIGR04086 family membrane protein [Oscillospiraceae bacterium]
MSETKKRSPDLAFLPHALAAWTVCAAALLLSGTVLYASDAAALSSLGYASSIISFLAAVGAGAAAASAQKERRFLKGILSGVFLTALLLLLGFLIRGRLDGNAVLSVLSFTLTGCALGAMLPVRKSKRSRFRAKSKVWKKMEN